MSLLALLAVVIAVARRIIAPPYPEARTIEAFFILALIATLMMAYFGINAARISRLSENYLALASTYMPVSSVVAGLIPRSCRRPWCLPSAGGSMPLSC